MDWGFDPSDMWALLEPKELTLAQAWRIPPQTSPKPGHDQPQREKGQQPWAIALAAN